jgi:hypothetical protein
MYVTSQNVLSKGEKLCTYPFKKRRVSPEPYQISTSPMTAVLLFSQLCPKSCSRFCTVALGMDTNAPIISKHPATIKGSLNVPVVSLNQPIKGKICNYTKET